MHIGIHSSTQHARWVYDWTTQDSLRVFLCESAGLDAFLGTIIPHSSTAPLHISSSTFNHAVTCRKEDEDADEDEDEEEDDDDDDDE